MRSGAPTHAVAAAAALAVTAALASPLALLVSCSHDGAASPTRPSGFLTGADFGIAPYVSPRDADGDGIDDQTDMLYGAKAWVSTRPAYRSAYYEGGWPDDGCGVCTDVVAHALLSAGIDLRAEVARDAAARPGAYGADPGDIDIAFRRVRNQVAWLDAHAERLTLDVDDVTAWQGGDVVAYGSPEHVAIVSDRRDEKGRPYVIHHGSPSQECYEEDRLGDWGGPVGHWRIG